MRPSCHVDAQRWLLLDHRAELPEKLYRCGESRPPWRLYDHTELAPYAGYGPLLVDAGDNPGLTTRVAEAPDDWPGLLLDSRQDVERLLQHLRHILFVGFEEQRKGVLRYSNPRTASYFFPACPEDERRTWLGPIERLTWYAATWREQADRQARWRSLENPHAAHWQPHEADSPLQLGQPQAHALRRQQAERFLHHWWSKQSTFSFERAWICLEAGMACCFQSTQSLAAYLDLRAAHPDQYTHAPLPAGSDEQRLDHLKASLERRPNDKERPT